MIPDYVLCADCEAPCYVFEWKDGKVTEAICEVCGNQDPATFMTEEEFDSFATDTDWRDRDRRR